MSHGHPYLLAYLMGGAFLSVGCYMAFGGNRPFYLSCHFGLWHFAYYIYGKLKHAKCHFKKAFAGCPVAVVRLLVVRFVVPCAGWGVNGT